MKAIQNSNIVNFPSPKRKLTNYGVACSEWKQALRTSDNKKLSTTELLVLWAIYRSGLNQETTEVRTTYRELQKYAKEPDKSEKQFKRYLEKIQKTGIVQFKSKRIPNNNAYELIIKVDLQHLENLLYGNSGGQKCPTEVSTRTPLEEAHILPVQDPLIDNKNISYLDNLDIEIEKNKKVVEPVLTHSNVTQFKPKQIPQKGKHPSEWKKFNEEEIDKIWKSQKGEPKFCKTAIIKIMDFMAKKAPSDSLFDDRKKLINYAISWVENERRNPDMIGQEWYTMVSQQDYQHHIAESKKEKIQQYAQQYRMAVPELQSPTFSSFSEVSVPLSEPQKEPIIEPIQEDTEWDESRSEVLNLWGKIRTKLRQYVGGDSERIYFSNIKITELEDGKIMFIPESPTILRYIRDNHALNLYKSFKTYGYEPGLDSNFNKEGIVFEPIKEGK